MSTKTYDLTKLGKETKQKRSNYRVLFTFIKPLLGWFMLALFFVLLNSAITVYAPRLIGQLTGDFLLEGLKDELYAGVAVVSALYFAAWVANVLQIEIIGSAGLEVPYKLRAAIFTKLQNLPLQFFNENRSGDLISRINNDTQLVYRAFAESILRFIGQFFILVGVALSMLWLNIELASFTLGIAALLIFINYIAKGKIRELNKYSLESTSSLSAFTQEAFTNFRVFVTTGQRDYLASEFERVNAEVRKNSTRAGIATSLMRPFYEFGSYIATFCLLAYSAPRIVEDPAFFGVFITFAIYLNQFYTPLRIMGELYNSLQSSIAAWGRLAVLLSMDDTETSQVAVSSKQGLLDNNRPSPKETLAVEFRDVSFRYPNSDEFVVKHVNLKLEFGKSYAFVGPTGSGKSTTVSLIPRLYLPTSGQIYLAGKSLDEIPQDEISQLVGFILQDPVIKPGTLLENLTYGNKKLDGISKEDMISHLKNKDLLGILSQFPDGLNTKIIPKQSNLSLGQYQIIAFLRAVLREPSILILDEATANIDTVTENLLQHVIDNLPSSTTLITIAHRLNTIESADQIFFVAGTDITAAGSLEDALLKIKNYKE